MPQRNELFADSPVLLIDDIAENLQLLEKMLNWAGFGNLRSFTSAQGALSILPEFDPHLVIVDLMMPGMTGYEFLENVRSDPSHDPLLPVLVFTADLTTEAKVRALELGASDFLTKPGDAIEIGLRVRHFLAARRLHVELQKHNEELEAKVHERTEHLAIARKEAVEILAMASEYRDDDTGQHSHRVGDMSAAIAEELGMNEDFVEALRLVAPLHDIGKIGIPDYILHKPGKLTTEEYEAIKLHVSIGAKLLYGKSSPLLNLAWEIAKFHHERWDGRGYGTGLVADGIPISARIVAVADAFDAITNDRPYRKGRSASEAMEELNSMSGKQFDPKVVEALNRVLDGALTLQKAA